MPVDDDGLLELLGRALEPPAVEPSMAEMHAFHRAVAAHHGPKRRWAPRTLALVIGLGALTTSGTAFAIEGGHVPRPVVSVAHSLGLPVDSPAFTAAKEAVERLQAALQQRDTGQIRAAAAAVRSRRGALSESERRSLGLDDWLAEADGVALRAAIPAPAVPVPPSRPSAGPPAVTPSPPTPRSDDAGEHHDGSPSTTRAPEHRDGGSSSGSSGSGSGSSGSGSGDDSGSGSSGRDGSGSSSGPSPTTTTIKSGSGSSGSGSSGSDSGGSGSGTSGSGSAPSGSGRDGGDHSGSGSGSASGDGSSSGRGA
ncbi:MAG: hypothetical protein QOG64_1862 [Acidimicrobiaceae bacterium]|nr:hypothetical protein [Acidimicrobiaceae bacterium]